MNYLFKLSLLAASSSLIVACGSGNSPASATPESAAVAGDARFTVQITNLTYAQPLSPAAVILHKAGFNSFIDGEVASLAVEMMAEGGSNTDILSEATAATQHIASASTAAAIGPSSMSEVLTLTVPSANLTDLRLSVSTMLVRTNDAFTGLNAANISNMAIGSSMTLNGPTWDSGTEKNTETSATMPGPGFGGEGFNAARDDLINKVRFHQGVVTKASTESGLASSDLGEEHRFDNPSSRIVISRVQ